MKDILPILSSDEIESRDSVHHSVERIAQKIEDQLELSQRTIGRQQKSIEWLEGLVDEHKKSLQTMEAKLLDAQRQGEGSRQLINKLLGDIARLNQDIDWYKRTYETRSIWGMLKEKLFHTKS